MKKFYLTVSATDWCGYEDTIEVWADSEQDAEDTYGEGLIEDYTESMGLVQSLGGWTEYDNLDEDDELIDEDDVTYFTVSAREALVA